LPGVLDQASAIGVSPDLRVVAEPEQDWALNAR